MIKIAFEDAWRRILENEGEEFHTKRGLPFTYEIDGNQLIPNRTEYPLHKSNFRKNGKKAFIPRNLDKDRFNFQRLASS